MPIDSIWGCPMFRTATFLLCTLFAAPLAVRAGSVLVTPPALVSNDSVVCVVSFLGDESTTATATLRVVNEGGQSTLVLPASR